VPKERTVFLEASAKVILIKRALLLVVEEFESLLELSDLLRVHAVVLLHAQQTLLATQLTHRHNTGTQNTTHKHPQDRTRQTTQQHPNYETQSNRTQCKETDNPNKSQVNNPIDHSRLKGKVGSTLPDIIILLIKK